uniref:B1159F04.4 protein n=2 Tax=Oryza sativa subsp. japonica TaxID=39947 RepID=Q7XK84_ORYSJ|nr:OSJNBb0046K02.15 [Oryza sativa Japonica Group]CAE75941.1 B1159F04.4 [Oryza sativa Japonica Group]
MAKTIKQRRRRAKDRAGIPQAGADRGELRAKPLRANATKEGCEGEGCKAKEERSRRGDGRRGGSRAPDVHRRCWGSTIGFGTRAATTTFGSCRFVGAGAKHGRHGESSRSGKGAPDRGRDPFDKPAAGAPSRFVTAGNGLDRARRCTSQPQPRSTGRSRHGGHAPKHDTTPRHVSPNARTAVGVRGSTAGQGHFGPNPPVFGGLHSTPSPPTSINLAPSVTSHASANVLRRAAFGRSNTLGPSCVAAGSAGRCPSTPPTTWPSVTSFGANQVPNQVAMAWTQPSFDLSMAAHQASPFGAGQPCTVAKPHAQAMTSPFATPYPQQGAAGEGTYEEPKTQQHLLGIRQRPGESIREYMRCFSQARCQVQDITEASVLNAASARLLEGELTRKIANKEPQTLEHLLSIIDGYTRGEEDSKRRQAIQAEYDKASVAAAQAQVQAQVAELGKAVMAVEEVQALRKEFDAQQASSHQQPVNKKVRKDLYCTFHGRSSDTTEQCRSIRQHGNAQDPRPQQGAAVEAPREIVQEQGPPAEQCQDVQRRVIQVITRADPPNQLSKRQKKQFKGLASWFWWRSSSSTRPSTIGGSLRTCENKHEEQILFDVVNIPYNYNAIFGRTTLNKFEAISTTIISSSRCLALQE